MNKRSVGVCILLSFLTCGLYGLYWFYCLTEDMNYASGEPGTGGLMSLILTLITCHIYALFWGYKMGEKVDRIKMNSGVPSSNSGVLYLILILLGFDIVVWAVMQSELNKMEC